MKAVTPGREKAVKDMGTAEERKADEVPAAVLELGSGTMRRGGGPGGSSSDLWP
ncbi:hypothetical protein NDU88_005208, partial [Pleurodeles waltl]